MSAEEVERIEEERARRVSERPANTEVDNTDRDFDPTKGMFTDSPGYEQAPAPFPDPIEEDPTKS
jgi:hypothetical protein